MDGLIDRDSAAGQYGDGTGNPLAHRCWGHRRLLFLCLQRHDLLSASTQSVAHLTLPWWPCLAGTEGDRQRVAPSVPARGIHGIDPGQLARGSREATGLGMGTPAQSTGQHRSRLPTATACSRRWSPPRFRSTSVLAAAGWPWPFRLRCWETGYFARPFQQLIQAGLDHRDPCCRHGVSPLQLAGRQHRTPGPRSSVRGKPRPAVRTLDARSDARPMLNHGGADTGTLSGTHAGETQGMKREPARLTAEDGKGVMHVQIPP